MRLTPPLASLTLALTLAAVPAAGLLAAEKKPAPAVTTAPPGTPSAAVDTKSALYDGRLVRLSEILGSVHYLRQLCKASAEDDWRGTMQEILDAEAKDEPARRQLFTAAFNRGYRAFASLYTDCTSSAVVAEERYRNEGATLASEIAAQFGN